VRAVDDKLLEMRAGNYAVGAMVAHRGEFVLELATGRTEQAAQTVTNLVAEAFASGWRACEAEAMRDTAEAHHGE
jgi:hypothetical protein